MSKSLEELQAYKSRLEADVRRSRQIQPDGLLSGSSYVRDNRNTPLLRNLEQVNKDIQNFVPVTDKAVLAEEVK